MGVNFIEGTLLPAVAGRPYRAPAAAGVMRPNQAMLLSYQYAHHLHDESELVGAVSSRQAIRAFEEFDWEGESDKAEKLRKCAPTLSLVSVPDKLQIWVSSVRTGSDLEFVSQCFYPGKVTKWFGLSSKEGTVSLDTTGFSKESAKKVIELFVKGDYEALKPVYDRA